ncbi:hypothetical protein WN943_029689 [Citrus x changshan-huyou]
MLSPPLLIPISVFVFLAKIRRVVEEIKACIASSRFKKRVIVGLDNRIEELIDLFIEVPPQLLVVAILDSVKSSLYQAIDSSLGRRREQMNKKPPCNGLRGLDGDAVKLRTDFTVTEGGGDMDINFRLFSERLRRVLVLRKCGLSNY